MPENLLTETSDGVVRLTLNRPEKRNALSLDLLVQLEQAIERIAADSKCAGRGSGGAAVRHFPQATIFRRWSARRPILIGSYLNYARG